MTRPKLRIGLVLETRDDALALGGDLDLLYHWREPKEIDAIVQAVRAAGHRPVVLGTPERLAREPGLAGDIDFILNLSVGFSTRNRLARGPSLFGLLGIPYSGADPYAKMVSQNKHLMKALWDAEGIPTPEWTYVRSLSEAAGATFPPFPCIVKPAHEGSSIGIGPDAVAHDERGLRERMEFVLVELGFPVIVERFIEGGDYHVGVIGNSVPFAFLGGLETTPDEGDLLYFSLKKSGRYSARRWEIEPSLMPAIEKAFRLLSPMDFGVLDLRITPDGAPYFLELNADATLHPDRTLANCCRLNGSSYDEMIARILHAAISRTMG